MLRINGQHLLECGDSLFRAAARERLVAEYQARLTQPGAGGHVFFVDRQRLLELGHRLGQGLLLQMDLTNMDHCGEIVAVHCKRFPEVLQGFVVQASVLELEPYFDEAVGNRVDIGQLLTDLLHRAVLLQPPAQELIDERIRFGEDVLVPQVEQRRLQVRRTESHPLLT